MNKLKKLIPISLLPAIFLTGCLYMPFNSKVSVEMEGSETITVNNSEEAQEIVVEEIPVTVDFEEEVTVTPTEEPVEEPVYKEIYDDVNKIYSKEAKNADEICLSFAGDVCFYDGYSIMSTFVAQGSDIDNSIDGEVLSRMRDADIFMLNNEFCYSNRGTPIEGKQYTLRSKPENVAILEDMGADIVSLANNHSYDYGPDALLDTIDVLNGAKVPFVGAGKNLEEAMKPAYFIVNGATVSFVSATQIERNGSPDTKEATETTPGVLRTLDATKTVKVIKEAEENSDFVVVYVHWGSENTDLVENSQRDLAKKYVEAGADLIIGDHSHCLQGIDYIGDVPVFYSMSNFWFNSKTVDTGLAEIKLSVEKKESSDTDNSEKGNLKSANSEVDTSETGNSNETEENNSDNGNNSLSVLKSGNVSVSIKEVAFYPAIQTNCHTKKCSDEDKERILKYLQGISNYANIDISTGIITKSDKDNNTQNGVNTCPNKKEPTPEPVVLPEAVVEN